MVRPLSHTLRARRALCLGLRRCGRPFPPATDLPFSSPFSLPRPLAISNAYVTTNLPPKLNYPLIMPSPPLSGAASTSKLTASHGRPHTLVAAGRATRTRRVER